MLAEIEGPEGLWWLTLLTPELVLAVLAAVAVIVLLASVVGLFVYRRLRHDARIPPLMLLLRLETTPPGTRRTLLKLRLRVQRALLRARRAIAASAREGRAAGDLAGLLERTERAAIVIDRDLQIGPPDDRPARREWLDRAHGRVEEFEAVANRLADTASVALASDSDANLDDLRSDADRELLALRAGVDALEGLRRPGPGQRDDRRPELASRRR